MMQRDEVGVVSIGVGPFVAANEVSAASLILQTDTEVDKSKPLHCPARVGIMTLVAGGFGPNPLGRPIPTKGMEIPAQRTSLSPPRQSYRRPCPSFRAFGRFLTRPRESMGRKGMGI